MEKESPAHRGGAFFYLVVLKDYVVFIKPIESIIMARVDGGGSLSRTDNGLYDVVPSIVTVTVFTVVFVTVFVPSVVVIVTVVFPIVVVGVVVVDVVVVSVVSVFADVASASVPLLTASISVTTGGVTTENRPHFSKNLRLSILFRSSSRTSSVIVAPRDFDVKRLNQVRYHAVRRSPRNLGAESTKIACVARLPQFTCGTLWDLGNVRRDPAAPRRA
jgi:hypothetical protein